MDYKYIEQLIERYWECSSTQLEERILQAFFSQDQIPEHLQKYRPIFTSLNDVRDAHLGKDFDERILSRIRPVRAKRLSVWKRISPLYQAAAMVAIVLTVGMAAQHSFQDTGVQTPVSAQSAPMDPDSQYTVTPAGINNTSAEMNQAIPDSTVRIIP